MTVCRRCGLPVYKEQDRHLRKEYPWYCPQCEENMYGFEVREGDPIFDYFLVDADDLEYPVAFTMDEKAEVDGFIQLCENPEVTYHKSEVRNPPYKLDRRSRL